MHIFSYKKTKQGNLLEKNLILLKTILEGSLKCIIQIQYLFFFGKTKHDFKL